SAPEGLTSSIMQRVRTTRLKKRSPLLWFIPVTGVVGLALVVVVSMGIFSSSSPGMGSKMAMNDATPSPVAEMSEEADTFGASSRAAFDDELSTPSATPALSSRNDVPIGGTRTVKGYSQVGLESNLASAESMTARLGSGLTDTAHWDEVYKSLNRIGDPFIRTDGNGNFSVEMGIYHESIEEFDEKVSSLLHHPEEGDQGSVLIRVTILK
ncbi:MAG: hypothetical protein KAH30_06295, partial [Caldisericia bacterium]|nr:hypothetical protein [Caldisericia bacterium]